jgi:hypothetical protein
MLHFPAGGVYTTHDEAAPHSPGLSVTMSTVPP